MAKEKMPVLYVSVADGARAELVRAVLEYEAASRGLSRGQALLELVREAADLASYPPEVRERIAEIEERIERESLGRFLADADKDSQDG